MSEASLQQNPGAAQVTGRAPALRPSVPLYRHMLYGSGLSHALDFVVLAHVHFMCEDGKTFSVDDLVETLRGEGIRSSNGKGLIGSKAVYESVGRLRTAGFLHRNQDNSGNFGKVSYTFYEFPSLNPNWTPPGVTDSGGNIPLPLSGEADATLPTSNNISAGQTASPDKARADKARADRRSGKRRVSAGQTASPDRRSGKPSPPHPPEEEDSSSPNPLTGTTGALPSQREDKPKFAAEEIAEAERFLQCMKRHQAGAASSRKLAPLLLGLMAAQDWPKITGLDKQQQELLEADIFKNTGGAVSWASCLPGWIKDLRRYEFARAAQKSAAGGSVPWCGTCESPDYRWFAPREGSPTKCPTCHPSVAPRPPEA
ncbi:hypothetical protein ABZ953_39000 [Streptomyces sp. NPDC046465]|uniref:hypothetical protein n=1 Tax=Streptomyces sp. NPDC046465 TaxID=3155810 RepID=UPI0033CC8753